ncbi:MAG TPA: Fe2+-dependent dioxygenase [Ramlibacter sp.]|nr:Fe2+-dependent dioxygenase [Ramlibacter sp.]
MLITFPLLDAGEIQQARGLLDDAPWADGRASAGEQAAQAKNNEQLPPACDASQKLQALLVRALDRSPAFLAAALPRKLFPPRFNRYRGASNHYGAHVDGAVRFTGDGTRVRTDISCTVFLSDPAGYDGGELEIQGPAGPQRIKLAAGNAVLYPGYTVHQVIPVTRGERLAAFFWVESMVRSAEQRELLHGLDTALTSLRSRHGDDAATVALTGTYHNLLRMWADS